MSKRFPVATFDRSLIAGSLRKHPFSSLFVAGDVSPKTFPAAKSGEKRMFSQARSQVRNRLVAFSLLVSPAVSGNTST